MLLAGLINLTQSLLFRLWDGNYVEELLPGIIIWFLSIIQQRINNSIELFLISIENICRIGIRTIIPIILIPIQIFHHFISHHFWTCICLYFLTDLTWSFRWRTISSCSKGVQFSRVKVDNYLAPTFAFNNSLELIVGRLLSFTWLFILLRLAILSVLGASNRRQFCWRVVVTYWLVRLVEGGVVLVWCLLLRRLVGESVVSNVCDLGDLLFEF